MARQVGLSKETHVERSTLTTVDGSVVQTGSVDMAVEDGALRARTAARSLDEQRPVVQTATFVDPGITVVDADAGPSGCVPLLDSISGPIALRIDDTTSLCTGQLTKITFKMGCGSVTRMANNVGCDIAPGIATQHFSAVSLPVPLPRRLSSDIHAENAESERPVAHTGVRDEHKDEHQATAPVVDQRKSSGSRDFSTTTVSFGSGPWLGVVRVFKAWLARGRSNGYTRASSRAQEDHILGNAENFFSDERGHSGSVGTIIDEDGNKKRVNVYGSLRDDGDDRRLEDADALVVDRFFASPEFMPLEPELGQLLPTVKAVLRDMLGDKPTPVTATYVTFQQ